MLPPQYHWRRRRFSYSKEVSVLANNKPPFYGWIVVVVACLCYGFGIAPGYYSWGFFAPHVMEDLDATRAGVGAVFGLFLLVLSLVGPLVGFAQSRWGVRVVMTVGSCAAAAGFALTSRATSLVAAFFTFSIIAGVGVGFSTTVPCQTLATHWFVRYRARATAVIMATGGLVGIFISTFDAWLLSFSTWRTGWLVIAAISAAVAGLAAAFVRTSPEEMGQRPDGEPSNGDPDEGCPAENCSERRLDSDWTVAKAARTPHFAVLIVCGLASVLPWGVAISHGPLHMRDLGYSEPFTAGLISTMALASIAGRICASLADLVSPRQFLAVALFVQGIGTYGFVLAQDPGAVYVSAAMLGLGFGAAYVAVAVVTAAFFGRQAFGTILGIRMSISGMFGAVAPWLAGLTYDRLGSYHLAFLALTLFGIVSAVLIAFCPRPRLPHDRPLLDEPPSS